MSQYIFEEPLEYAFENRDGHSGKKYAVSTTQTNALIIECEDNLTVSYLQKNCDFNYYILSGKGYFVFNDGSQEVVKEGDLVAIPAGTKFSFGGKLKMLLIGAPSWSTEQEQTFDA